MYCSLQTLDSSICTSLIVLHATINYKYHYFASTTTTGKDFKNSLLSQI